MAGMANNGYRAIAKQAYEELQKGKAGKKKPITEKKAAPAAEEEDDMAAYDEEIIAGLLDSVGGMEAVVDMPLEDIMTALEKELPDPTIAESFDGMAPEEKMELLQQFFDSNGKADLAALMSGGEEQTADDEVEEEMVRKELEEAEQR